MKIKDGFMLRSFSDENVVVAVGEDAQDFNKLITLNSVGAYIYGLLSRDMSYDEIISGVLEKYDVDKKTAEADVSAFLGQVKDAGLLDE